jgi:hypothetical protein
MRKTVGLSPLPLKDIVPTRKELSEGKRAAGELNPFQPPRDEKNRRFVS